MSKYVTAAEAVKIVESGNRVYVQAAAATPSVLTQALAERAGEPRNVEVCHLHTEGEAPMPIGIIGKFSCEFLFYRQQRTPYFSGRGTDRIHRYS